MLSFIAFFVLSFFLRDVLDEIWDLIESNSESFLNLNFMATWYNFRKIIGKYDFPYHFKKIFVRYKTIG